MNSYQHHMQCRIMQRARDNRAIQRLAAIIAGERRYAIDVASHKLRGVRVAEEQWDGQWAVLSDGPLAVCNLTREEAHRVAAEGPRPRAAVEKMTDVEFYSTWGYAPDEGYDDPPKPEEDEGYW